MWSLISPLNKLSEEALSQFLNMSDINHQCLETTLTWAQPEETTLWNLPVTRGTVSQSISAGGKPLTRDWKGQSLNPVNDKH